MITLIILSGLTGFLVKLTDEINDVQIISGIMYGLLIGLVSGAYPIVGNMWLGVVLGNIIAGKFDKLGHIVSLPALLVPIFLFDAKYSITLLGLFTVISFVEEKVNDNLDNLKPTRLTKLLQLRPLIEITALIISDYSLVLSILSFDILYNLSPKLLGFKAIHKPVK